MTDVRFEILRRSIEAVMLAALWQTYSSATCLQDVWSQFCGLEELGKIGTVTSLILLADTVIECGRSCIHGFSKRLPR